MSAPTGIELTDTLTLRTLGLVSPPAWTCTGGVVDRLAITPTMIPASPSAAPAQVEPRDRNGFLRAACSASASDRTDTARPLPVLRGSATGGTVGERSAAECGRDCEPDSWLDTRPE